MNWLQKISQRITEVQRSSNPDSMDYALQYFNIGHCDYNEEFGKPCYVAWIYLEGEIQTSGVMIDNNLQVELSDQYNLHGPSGTHRSIWGQDATNRLYRGRYEPETGRLSIVKPEGLGQMRDIPNSLWSALRRKFKKLEDVKIF